MKKRRGRRKESGRRAPLVQPVQVPLEVDNSIFEHVRINRSVYEMFEMRASGRCSKEIVIKNDPGAEITLVAPRLYDWALKNGLLRNIVRHRSSVAARAGVGLPVPWRARATADLFFSFR